MSRCTVNDCRQIRCHISCLDKSYMICNQEVKEPQGVMCGGYSAGQFRRDVARLRTVNLMQQHQIRVTLTDRQSARSCRHNQHGRGPTIDKDP